MFDDLRMTIPTNDGKEVWWSAPKIGVHNKTLAVHHGSCVIDLLAGATAPATDTKTS